MGFILLLCEIYVNRSVKFMHIKKVYGLIFSVAMAAIFALSGFSLEPSTASTHQTASEPINSASELLAQSRFGTFKLPPLPYEYDALDEFIDTQTMTLHHDKHHAGYVKNLNKAISSYPSLRRLSIEDILRDLDRIPEDIQSTVRKNGGGHANHSMFWEIMTPDSSGEPTGDIAKAINDTFGDFATFQEEFNTAGKKRFGSGWAWLVMNKDGSLEVTSTGNQDSPFMQGQYPIMGNDVWEHAYYLKYQNKRGDYLDAWWNVLNWDEINNRLDDAQSWVKEIS